MEPVQDVLIAFILDASGSMMNVTDATCEGFNQFKTDQKANPGQACMTLTLFNTTFDTRFIGAPLEEVPDLGLTTNAYRPDGGTALFDAVGVSVKATEKWVQDSDWTGRVMVVILTDGEENSSRSWHVRSPREDGDAFDVAGLIDWKQKEGWDFIFLGAGGTEWLERTFKELPREAFLGYAGDAQTTRRTYAGVSNAMTQSRAGGQSLSAALANQDQDTSEATP